MQTLVTQADADQLQKELYDWFERHGGRLTPEVRSAAYVEIDCYLPNLKACSI